MKASPCGSALREIALPQSASGQIRWNGDGASSGSSGTVRIHALSGVVMEIFHMRVMQPAVEHCLSRGVYIADRDTTALLREIDALSERAVTAASGDAATARRTRPLVPVRGGGESAPLLRSRGMDAALWLALALGECQPNGMGPPGWGSV